CGVVYVLCFYVCVFVSALPLGTLGVGLQTCQNGCSQYVHISHSEGDSAPQPYPSHSDDIFFGNHNVFHHPHTHTPHTRTPHTRTQSFTAVGCTKEECLQSRFEYGT